MWLLWVSRNMDCSARAPSSPKFPLIRCISCPEKVIKLQTLLQTNEIKMPIVSIYWLLVNINLLFSVYLLEQLTVGNSSDYLDMTNRFHFICELLWMWVACLEYCAEKNSDNLLSVCAVGEGVRSSDVFAIAIHSFIHWFTKLQGSTICKAFLQGLRHSFGCQSYILTTQ